MLYLVALSDDSDFEPIVIEAATPFKAAEIFATKDENWNYAQDGEYTTYFVQEKGKPESVIKVGVRQTVSVSYEAESV